MLPASLNDLLDQAPVSHAHTGQTLDVQAALLRWAPGLTAVAHTNGAMIQWADYAAFGLAACTDLVRQAAEQFVTRTCCNTLVNTAQGPYRALGVRLPGPANDELLICLVPPAALADMATEAEVATAVSASNAWAFARTRSAAAELEVRVEQLSFEQNTMRYRYTESLADAVEEHEQRLREQETARLELHRVHAHNQLILDSAGEGIIGLDASGRITFANPAVRRMLLWSTDEIVGRQLEDLVRGTQIAAGSQCIAPWPVRQTLNAGTTAHSVDELFQRRDGTVAHVEYVATPIQEDDRIVGAVVTLQDVTQRKVLEGQLIQAQKLESIGQLAAGIAHEINTPTQFIGDNLRFLKDAFADLTPLLATRGLLHDVRSDLAACGSEQPELSHTSWSTDMDYLLCEVPKAIDQSLEGVERVANIVRSMKEFSHPDGNEKLPVDINKALESTLTVCRNEWKYCAEAILDLDPNLPLVNCLPGACNQVFLNLMVNAAHAIVDRQNRGDDTKGVITVRTRLEADWVEVHVSDNGCGIPASIRDRIFDPFFTTKEVGKGTGQGLAIARSVVVDRHGGELLLETNAGRGTTFVVRLPRPVDRA